MSEVVKAPWTQEQVDALNAFQTAGLVHPFTCGYCRDRYGTRFVREDNGDHRPLSEDEENLLTDWISRLVKEEIGFDEFTSNVPVQVEIDDHILVATMDGWICPTCDYTQDWAHELMLERIGNGHHS